MFLFKPYASFFSTNVYNCMVSYFTPYFTDHNGYDDDPFIVIATVGEEVQRLVIGVILGGSSQLHCK